MSADNRDINQAEQVEVHIPQWITFEDIKQITGTENSPVHQDELDAVNQRIADHINWSIAGAVKGALMTVPGEDTQVGKFFGENPDILAEKLTDDNTHPRSRGGNHLDPELVTEDGPVGNSERERIENSRLAIVKNTISNGVTTDQARAFLNMLDTLVEDKLSDYECTVDNIVDNRISELNLDY